MILGRASWRPLGQHLPMQGWHKEHHSLLLLWWFRGRQGFLSGTRAVLDQPARFPPPVDAAGESKGLRAAMSA